MEETAMKAVSKLFLSIVLLSSIVFQCCINPSLATDTFTERDTYVEIEQQHSEEPLSDITDTTRIVFDADTSETM